MWCSMRARAATLSWNSFSLGYGRSTFSPWMPMVALTASKQAMSAKVKFFRFGTGSDSEQMSLEWT